MFPLITTGTEICDFFSMNGRQQEMMAILENLILNKKFKELRKLVKKSIDRIINLEESHCQDQATKLLH